jgi:hypothetical protein
MERIKFFGEAFLASSPVSRVATFADLPRQSSSRFCGNHDSSIVLATAWFCRKSFSPRKYRKPEYRQQ